MSDPLADYRLADDRPIGYLATTVDGRQFRWTGTPDWVNRAVTIRSGPMLLLCDDSTIVNFAHVVTLEPIAGATTVDSGNVS